MGVPRNAIEDVSSHAPVRGHPLNTIIGDTFIEVSSHAPVRGHPPFRLSNPPPEKFQVMPP